MLIAVGEDAGPSFAGGRSAAMREFESKVLQHLSICTVAVPHGSGKDFLTLLLWLL